MDEEPFGHRLRAERERRRITLELIAANTRIPITLLRDLEADRLDRWPRGLVRRSFVKTYASALGLEPDDILREFLARFPDRMPWDPVPDPRAAVTSRAVRPVLRLTFADEPRVFSGGQMLRSVRSRLLAVACDLLLPVVIAATLHVVVGWFWMLLAVSALSYVAIATLVLGHTPGIYLFAPGRPIEVSEAGDEAGHLSIFEESLIR